MLLHKISTFQTMLNANKVRIGFRILAVILGALHTWAAITSQSMNADGIAYLDIGDAYFRADWENAINTVWPPLYSWLLGFVNAVFRPSMTWEFPTVHILNFFIYLGAMVCFEFMWGKLGNNKSSENQNGSLSLPTWACWAIGYSLFIWTSLSMIQIWAVTPDMLAAALLYLAAGLIIEIRNGSRQWHTYLILGLVLGLGYLAKTLMFSTALVFLGICLVLVHRTQNSIAKVVLSVGAFLLVCLPFIVLISINNGGITIGEAGTITYLKHVQGLPFSHWQGDPSNQIIPSHPSRVIHLFPTIYEFGEPIGGTYPISTDPSYWYAGIEMPFSLHNQLSRILISSLFYLEIFFQNQGVLLACVIALYMMGPKHKLSFIEITRKWALVIPAIIAFGLYGLVLVAGRYIAAFILLFWADILTNIRLANTTVNKLWLKTLSAISVIGILANILIFNLDGINRLNPTFQSNTGEQTTLKPASHVEVAQTLHQLGIEEGDRVAVIGYGFDSFWARLARVRIVAEMPEDEAKEFWTGSETLRQSVLGAFAGSGVIAVVAEYVPENAQTDGWHRVEDSNLFIYRLKAKAKQNDSD
jgi:hypothetical protein